LPPGRDQADIRRSGIPGLLAAADRLAVAPILFGVDKFATCRQLGEVSGPWIRDLSPLSATHTMYVVGVVVIIAGVLVRAQAALRRLRRRGCWPGSSSTALLLGYYDVALRDFGLMLGRSRWPGSRRSTTRPA